MSVTSTLVDALIELAIAEDCSMGTSPQTLSYPKIHGGLFEFCKGALPLLWCHHRRALPRKFNISTGDLTWMWVMVNVLKRVMLFGDQWCFADFAHT